MTVGKLMNDLKHFPSDRLVAVYADASEDMDFIKRGPRLETKSDPETMSYCKAGHLLDFDIGVIDEIVVIG